MKRAAALVRLSRDHHAALVAARRLRRATAVSSAADRDAFLRFWDSGGARHFRIEEEVLLPAIARWVDPHHDLVARTLGDHVAIRARVGDLRETGEVTAGWLHVLGDALATHVRMEERELFALIERVVPDRALDRIADAVERAERGDRR